MHIVFYASAHGMGHVVRLAEVGRTLLARAPDCRLSFRGRVRPELLSARVNGSFNAAPGEVDAGLAESDHATQDLNRTAQRGAALLEEWDELRSREVEFLSESQASAVVCDLPGIPLEAAADVRIPGIAIGNFSWDWVYEWYHEKLGDPVFARMAERFAGAYRTASCLARIPVGPPMRAFHEVVDVGLVGRKGDEGRAGKIREHYGLPSPTAFLAIGKAAEVEMLRGGIQKTPGYRFFGFLDLGGAIPSYTKLEESDQKFFPELLTIADVVVTTLGHSILSECAANGTPIVTPPRLDYPEYDVLLSEASRCHPIVEIDLGEFRAGRWMEALERARTTTPPEPTPSTDGASDIARLILRVNP